MTDNMADMAAAIASAASQKGPSPQARDLDEHLAKMQQIPFFMKELPDDAKAGGGSSSASAMDDDAKAAFEALQSLAHDGDPDEIASNFKSHGNEYFVGKRYREALGFYTQALDAEPKDPKLRETLFANRAACQLELQNYGSALRDTSSALGINPRNTKAFYRAARALLALDKLVEALDCCDHALEIEADNSAVRTLRQQIVKKQADADKKAKERTERERRAKELKVALDRALLARGLWVETTPKPPDNPTPLHFDPESLLPSSSPSHPLISSTPWVAPDPIRTPLVFPVFFLYPQHGQSDLISHYQEDVPLSAHLDAMFPPTSRGSLPWDEKGEYYSENLNVYVATRAKRLLKLGRKLSLREVLDQGARDADKAKGVERDGVVLRDGLLSLIVLPKGEAEKEWIDRFKKERDGGANQK